MASAELVEANAYIGPPLSIDNVYKRADEGIGSYQKP